MRYLCAVVLALMLMIPVVARGQGIDRPLQMRDHEALWTHCTADWSPESFGDTLCGWALVNGYPETAPEGVRSCARAAYMGNAYFLLIKVPRNVAGLYCALAVEFGPSLLSDW